MRDPHSAHNCHWAQPTLQLQWPFWYAASDDAWTCTCNGVPRILHDPVVCSTCRRWRPTEDTQASAAPQPGCEHQHALVFRPAAEFDIPTVS